MREDGDLGVEPISELRSLRADRLVNASGRQVAACNEALDDVFSDTIEVVVELESDGADRYGLAFKEHPNGDERALVYYDDRDETLTLHREEASRALEFRKTATKRSSLVHSGDLEITDETLRLHLFVDRSMVECYANAKQSITTRVYSDSPQSTGLSVWADGDVVVHELSVWDLDPIW